MKYLKIFLYKILGIDLQFLYIANNQERYNYTKLYVRSIKKGILNDKNKNKPKIVKINY